MRWLCRRRGPGHPPSCCLLSKGCLTANHQTNLPVGKSIRATWCWGKACSSTVQKQTCTSTAEARMRESGSLWLGSPFTHAPMALTVSCAAQVMSFWTRRMFLKQSLQMGSNVSFQPSESLGISTLIYPAANHLWHCSHPTFLKMCAAFRSSTFPDTSHSKLIEQRPANPNLPSWGVRFWLMWDWEVMLARKLVENVQKIKSRLKSGAN